MLKAPLAIIPAAGNSTRMGEMCKDWPKWALEIDGRPILERVMSFWRRYADSMWVVVQPRFRATAFDIVQRAGLVGTVHLAEAADSKGVPDTVLRGLEAAGGCPPRFLVALADCLWDGEFEEVDLGAGHGIAVADPDNGDWNRSYSVDLYDDVSGVRVRGLMEKPSLGLGAYWFRWTALQALESMRNKSITDAVAELVWAPVEGCEVMPVRFHGFCRNVTFPDDLRAFP